jgi:putative ABC transport system permease protein
MTRSLDLKMAWRNVWRNPRRSVLTILAIAFATILLVFMLSFQLGAFGTMIEAAVSTHTGHVQIQAQGYQDKHDMALVVPDPGAIAGILAQTPSVSAWTFRAKAFSLATSRDRTYGTLVVGIDAVRERSVTTLARLVRQGAYLSGGGGNEALLGRILAKNLRVSVGDELALLGQGRDGSIAATVVTVRGIISTGNDEFDRATLCIPLPFFQEVYTMGPAVHEVVAVCSSLKAVPAAAASLRRDVPRAPGGEGLVVLDWEALMPGLIEVITMKLASGFIMYLILIVVVAFSILNTFLMAILERTREFGVLLALGAAPHRLMRIVLAESFHIAVLGIVIGVAAGSILTLFFQSHGILMEGFQDMARQYGLAERIYPQLSLLSVGIGTGIVLVITILTALWPALRVLRLRPVQAMAAG